MAAKLVAFVTAGYPPDALASFEGSVRAGVAREFLNGAAVVHADEAAVAAAIPAVLGEYGVPAAGQSLPCMPFSEKHRRLPPFRWLGDRGGRVRVGGSIPTVFKRKLN